MADKKKSTIATIAFMTVVFFWGTTFAVNKSGLASIKPLTLMMFRFILGALLLSVIYIRKLKLITFKDIQKGSVIGMFLFAAMFAAVFGIAYTTASKQAFIVNSFVLIMPYLAWAFNKIKPNVFAVAATFMATFGLAMITIQKGVTFNAGDIFSFIASILFAFHMLTIERFSAGIDPIICTIVQFWFCAAAFFICVVSSEGFDISALNDNKYFFAYTVVFTTVLPFLVQTIVQKYLTSVTVSLIMACQSPLGAIFAFFYLGELMTKSMIAGCVILFAAVILQQTELSFVRKKI